jgi:hypothetical protein
MMVFKFLLTCLIRLSPQSAVLDFDCQNQNLQNFRISRMNLTCHSANSKMSFNSDSDFNDLFVSFPNSW